MQQAHKILASHIAKRRGLEPKLVIAVCLQKSVGDTFAHRFEPHYRYLLDNGRRRPYRVSPE